MVTASPHNGTAIFAYKFTVQSKPVYVLWSTTSQTVNLTLSSSSANNVTTTSSVPNDTLGNFSTQTISASGGTVSLNISPTAIFVEENTSSSVFENQEKTTKFELFPNPASENITIETSPDAVLEIINQTGQNMGTFKTNGIITINIKELPSGVYTVKSTFERNLITKLFIKK